MTNRNAPSARRDMREGNGMMVKQLLRALGLTVVLALALMIYGDVNAATLNTDVKIVVSTDFASAGDLVTSDSKLRATYTLALASGTGADQADMIFSDQRTLTASTTEDLDVSGGALTDAFGTTFTITKVKAIVVCAASGNTNDVVAFGDAASVLILDTAATTHTIAPGGCFAAFDPTAGGWAVTDSTGDILQFANSAGGTSVIYDLVVIGTSS